MTSLTALRELASKATEALNGHIDIVEQLHDYLRAGLDKLEQFGGESGGKLQDFADSLGVVLSAIATLTSERDELAGLLATPWDDEFGNEPRPTPIRGYVDLLVAGEDFRVTRQHAIALGAALIRAATKGEQ